MSSSHLQSCKRSRQITGPPRIKKKIPAFQEFPDECVKALEIPWLTHRNSETAMEKTTAMAFQGLEHSVWEKYGDHMDILMDMSTADMYLT
jgi:hypothetical protein